MIDTNNPRISIRRQCSLLGIAPSSYYYESAEENALNFDLMHKIDRIHTDYPFFGLRRLQRWLKREYGVSVNIKRIHRLVLKMGLTTIYPKKGLSIPNKAHRKYPYLLNGLEITKPCQVWSTDITYIPLASGFAYLVAVMDWFSRYVIAWELSNSLDITFCIEALELSLSRGHPNIFNTDQGSQFTSPKFTSLLEKQGIQISMDGRGRAFDNIFIERLWRSLKYEEVYCHAYQNMDEAYHQIKKYFRFYNNQRPHQSLGYKTPHEVHFPGSTIYTVSSDQLNMPILRDAKIIEPRPRKNKKTDLNINKRALNLV